MKKATRRRTPTIRRANKTARAIGEAIMRVSPDSDLSFYGDGLRVLAALRAGKIPGVAITP